jgi:hypothetical protein
MKQTDFWDRLWQEAKVILGIAGGITTALWIKRLIEKLSSQQIIDKDIVEHGLEQRVPVPVAPSPSPSSSAPGWPSCCSPTDFLVAAQWAAEGYGKG